MRHRKGFGKPIFLFKIVVSLFFSLIKSEKVENNVIPDTPYYQYKSEEPEPPHFEHVRSTLENFLFIEGFDFPENVQYTTLQVSSRSKCRVAFQTCIKYEMASTFEHPNGSVTCKMTERKLHNMTLRNSNDNYLFAKSDKFLYPFMSDGMFYFFVNKTIPIEMMRSACHRDHSLSRWVMVKTREQKSALSYYMKDIKSFINTEEIAIGLSNNPTSYNIEWYDGTPYKGETPTNYDRFQQDPTISFMAIPINGLTISASNITKHFPICQINPFGIE